MKGFSMTKVLDELEVPAAEELEVRVYEPDEDGEVDGEPIDEVAVVVAAENPPVDVPTKKKRGRKKGEAGGEVDAEMNGEATPEVAPATPNVAASTIDPFAAERAAKPVPQPTTPVPTPSQAELDFLRDKRDAEERLSSRVVYRRKCEDELKLAKKSEKLAAEILEKILADGVSFYPLFDRPVKEAEEVKKEEAATAEQSPVEPAKEEGATSADPSSSDWRSVPLTVLALKPALEGRLMEAGYDTIGKLEDLRAAGNAKGVGLRSIKGIGDSKVTEIEDAVIAWLSENRDAAVLAAAK